MVFVVLAVLLLQFCFYYVVISIERLNCGQTIENEARQVSSSIYEVRGEKA